MKNVFIVIPAFNEERRVGGVIRGLKSQGFKNILVVDDCSEDKTAFVAEQEGALVLHHLVNRGPGAATYTGIQAALLKGAEVLVTLDADGQHHPEDVIRLVEELEKSGMDVIIGSRFLDKKQLRKIPFLRVWFNRLGSLITWFLSGIYLSDSQSGFKVFSRYAAEQIEIQTNGFEFCSEIVREIRYHGLKYREIPIAVYYSDYTKAKGQNFSVGVETFFKLFVRSLMR